ncbi:uncharacterized protein LOC135212242 [Macrobrachium nipponense]|uniref:uncharacterized protein LOC135212242 n=1 Tax=Macrobrachium nipponense TaxID=159736 RepID=UPI0030C86568
MTFFENARARFHQELTNFLAEWDDTEEMDDSWFGKEAILSRQISPEAQLSSHSKIRDNKFAACVNENGDYEVMMNISELKLKDFKVRVTGERTVMVEGYKEEGNSIRSCHRSPRNFRYQFSLPDNATSDAVSAVLSRDGILIITIPSKARNARNSEISLMENDIVNRANIIGESGEKCGRKSKVIEIQNCQSAADSSGSNLILSSHRGSLESAPGRDPLVRCEKEAFQTLKKKEDGSRLTEKNDIYTESCMESFKNNSSSTSSFTESKDSFSQNSLAKERRVKETIIPIRMEESGDRCLRSQAQSEVTIFHQSSLHNNDSCLDKDTLYHLKSSNANMALSQSEESVTNSTELQNKVLRCTNDNEESSGTPEHSTVAQRSEGLQMPSEGNIVSRDPKGNEMVTTNKCMSRSTQSRNTKFNDQEILSDAKNSEIIARECGNSEGVTDEKETAANFRAVHLVQKMSSDSQEESRSLLCDNKRGKPMTLGITQELQIMNKSLFLEDSHFISVKASVISALKEILSGYGNIPETADVVGFYRKCQEENVMDCNTLSFSQEEDSSYKFVVDVCNLKMQSLTVCVKNEREICIEGRHQPKRGTLHHSQDFTKSFLLPRDAVIGSASASVSSDGFLLISVNKEGSIEAKSDVTHVKGMLETIVANQHSDEEEEAKVFRDVNKLSQEHQGQQQVLHRNEREQELASDSSSASIASCASVAASHGISEEQIVNVKEGAEQQEVLSISEVITPKVEEDAKFFDSKDRAYYISQEQQMMRLPSEKADSDEFQNNSFLERKEQKQSLEIQALETSTNRVTEEVTQEHQDYYLVASPSSTPFEETGKLQELEASVTAIEELNGISSNDNCRPLPVQEKGLFDEDAFYESVRHHFKVQKMETSSEHADSSFISGDVDGKIIIPLLDDQEDYEKTNYFENDNEYTIILNVGKHLKETEMEVKVVSGNRVLIRCSSFLNEGELDHLRVFSKTFHLPDDIDVTSGLCGISLDGILAVTFTKKVSLDAVQVTSLDEACSKESSQKDWKSYILRGKSVLNVEESTNSEDFTGQELTLSLEDEEVNSSYGEEDNTEKTTTAEDEICDEAESFSRDTNAFWQATCCTASPSRTRTSESESVQDPFHLLNAGESESGEKALWMRETTAKDTMNGTLAGVTVEEFAQEEVGFKSTSSDGQSQKV